MANRRQFNSRPRRPTKWVSSQIVGPIPDQSTLVVADGIPMTVPTTESVNQPDPTVVSVRGQIAVHRATPGADMIVIAWAIVLMRLDVGTAAAVQIFNPFLTSELDRQDILGMGFVESPASLLNSADARASDFSSKVVEVNVRTSRIVQQNTNNLFFWISSADQMGAGSDGAFNVRASFRTLLKFK